MGLFKYAVWIALVDILIVVSAVGWNKPACIKLFLSRLI